MLGRSKTALPRLSRAASSVAGSPLLHNSPIPTYFFQESLPRLPIPTLDETCSKYLTFVEPLLSEAQLATTRAAVEQFRSGAGPQLQEHLVSWDKANKGTSYISAMWYDMYLENRDALPLNLTPQLTWLDHPVPEKNDQATRAADLIHAAARFHLTLEAEKLDPDIFHTKPEVSRAPWFQQAIATLVPRKVAWYAEYLFAKAYPLDMSQYPRLFKSTRLPRRGRDELWSAERSRHIVVQRGPRFYSIDVLTEAGEPVPAAAIEAQLRAIIAESPTRVTASAPYTGPNGAVSSFTTFKHEGPPLSWAQGGQLAATYAKEAPVGALTALNRDEWADARAALEGSSAHNKAALRAIDSALFVLTLEHESPQTHEDLSRAMLHGDGRNRWFDKCFNVVVCGNGKAGIAWEHAWGDGVAVLYFFNEVYKALNEAPARSQAAPAALGPQHRITFDLTSSEGGKAAAAAARRAEAFTDKLVGETDLRVYQSPSMTKADVKKSGLAPDGVMQMILQLAHWRAHGTTPSTYESASTAGFKHGRTEVIRPVTVESVEMCKLFSDPSASHAARFAALGKATATHRKTTVDCMMGKGVDRHLYALHKWSERLAGTKPGLPAAGAPPPSLFADPAYGVFKDIRLSTSTLASPALAGGGFGPVSRTSYGVGYGIEERGAHFHVMNYKTAGSTTDNAAFVGAVEQALQDFHATIAAAAPAKKDKGEKA